MIKVILNGKESKFDKKITVRELVQTLSLKPDGLVVQINEEIISKDKYAGHQVNDGDQIELIKFMAGG